MHLVVLIELVIRYGLVLHNGILRTAYSMWTGPPLLAMEPE